MYLINALTSDPRQKHAIIHPLTGLDINLTIEYSPMQYAWFSQISYENFSLNGFRIFTSINMLRQFGEIIPFGMACLVDDNQEPLLQGDFSSGRAKLYILTTSEVQEVEGLINE